MIDVSKVFEITNQFRSLNGVKSLALSKNLAAAAVEYSTYLANHPGFEHNLEGDPFTRIKSFGYTGYVGENIARGFTTADAVMVAWENSPGHRANLLDSRYTSIGIGAVVGPYGEACTQDFGFGGTDSKGGNGGGGGGSGMRFNLIQGSDGSFIFAPSQVGAYLMTGDPRSAITFTKQSGGLGLEPEEDKKTSSITPEKKVNAS